MSLLIDMTSGKGGQNCPHLWEEKCPRSSLPKVPSREEGGVRGVKPCHKISKWEFTYCHPSQGSTMLSLPEPGQRDSGPQALGCGERTGMAFKGTEL